MKKNVGKAAEKIAAFKKEIRDFYKHGKRDLPWRHTRDPYKVLVSEIMLQQTQVSRVKIKFKNFIDKFPTLKKLAAADKSEVLREWQGLGYNRRALNLKRAAELATKEYGGELPKDRALLESLPGIGQSTSGAILSFAYNIPAPFIETNIRAVYLYFFFKGISSVSDKNIMPFIEETVDMKNPREWFFALYDYGTALKAELGKHKTTLHKQSKHYNKQSKFEGSNRQVRSRIVSFFLAQKAKALFDDEQIFKKLTAGSEKSAGNPGNFSLPSISKNTEALNKEGFLERVKDKYCLAA